MLVSILLLIVLTFLNAVFASAEIAVISINDTKLRTMADSGNKRAKKLAKLTEQPARFLATIQVAITLSGFLSSAFAADKLAEPVTESLIKSGVPVPEDVLSIVMLIVITVVLAYFNLVFGELVPKRIAMKKSEALGLGMAGMLYATSKIFRPLVALLTVSTNFILKLLRMKPDEDDEKVSEEEIRMMIAEGRTQGVIDEHEDEIIQNVLDFDDTSAEQICVHRRDVIAFDEEDPLSDWEEEIWDSKHTLYPVYRENKDDIIGILDTRDYFALVRKDAQAGPNEIKSLLLSGLKPVFYIPEDMKAGKLFQIMQTERKHFAVLLDEYGGMSGIITIHDLIEELVGNLYDPEEEEEPEKIVQISDDKFRIAGDAELEDIEKMLAMELPTDDYDTFNGFVCGITGRIPEDGETFTCEDRGLHIEVTRVEGHRVAMATVTKCAVPEEDEE